MLDWDISSSIVGMAFGRPMGQLIHEILPEIRLCYVL